MLRRIMKHRRELELCVETLQGCEAARDGGVDRIELCAALSEGGVTPSRGFLRAALEDSSVPVHALMRPRSGNFVYSAAEFRGLCADVEDALVSGAAGIVFGVVTADRRIDRTRTKELIRLAAGRSVTFHRGFDRTANLFDALESLIDLGCDRILTSGGRPTVSEGYETLAALVQRARGRIRIAAGGGVTLLNASRLMQIDGLDLHASLRPKAIAVDAMDPLWKEEDASRISADAVRTLREIVHPGIA